VNSHKAQIVALPECFNSPYGTHYFNEYAESIDNGPTIEMMSKTSRDLGIYLIGGSIPERSSDGKLYNTCIVFDPQGNQIARHRKVHLFDINIPGKITFYESKVLAPGNDFTHFNTEYGKIGLGICYDIRFPELAMKACKDGCVMMIYPGAFNLTTGPMHWTLLQRARAVDNQMYVAAVSPARDPNASYQAYGHTSLIDPTGKVVAEAQESEEIITATVDLSLVDSFREQIPVLKQKRNDMYKLSFK
jgi:omega-amidase